MNNMKKKCKELKEKIQSGEMSINEARKTFDLPPIEKGNVLLTKAQLLKAR